MKKSTVYFLATIAFAIVAVQTAEAAFVAAGGVRYKTFDGGTNEEVYLGVPDLGVNGGFTSRAAQRLTWKYGPEVNSFTFKYDAVADKLTSQVNISSLLTYADFLSKSSSKAAAVADQNVTPWDALQIFVRGENTTGSVTLQNLTLLDNTGSSLVISVPTLTSGASGITKLLGGYNFGLGFTLSGELLLAQPLPNNDGARVEFGFGNSGGTDIDYLVADVPEPASVAVWSVGGLGIMLARRKRRQRSIAV